MTLATLRRLSGKIHADRLRIEKCWCNVRVRDGESYLNTLPMLVNYIDRQDKFVDK